MAGESDFIFGAGKVLERHVRDIDLSRIEAFVDNRPEKWGRLVYGKTVISPQELARRAIHRVYIASSKFFAEIYCQLVDELGIPAEKIKGLYYILPNEELSLDGKHRVGSYQIVRNLFDTLRVLGAASVAIEGDGLRAYGVLTPYDSRMASWRDAGEWHDVRQIHAGEHYDAVVLVDPLPRLSYKALVEQIRCLHRQTGAICVFDAYGKMEAKQAEWLPLLRRDFPMVQVRQYAECAVIVVGKEASKPAGIFTVMHKAFTPIHYANHETGYATILAGAVGKTTSADFRDDQGENISYLNSKINECTALYWIWRHERRDIVGFCHYRRYFLYRQGVAEQRWHILTTGEAARYLKNADILVAEPVCNYQRDGVVETIRSTTVPEAFQVGWKAIETSLRKYQPDYLDTFYEVMHSTDMFPCNMFVTRWEIFDQYCSWLFSFLIPAAEAADVSAFDNYSSRIIGFFAERMLTVWLTKQNLRIRTLPILQIEL